MLQHGGHDMLQHGGHNHVATRRAQPCCNMVRHVATRCDMLHEGTICRSMVARSKTPLEEAKLGGQDATAIQATMQARARCHVSVRHGRHRAVLALCSSECRSSQPCAHMACVSASYGACRIAASRRSWRPRPLGMPASSTICARTERARAPSTPAGEPPVPPRPATA